MALSGTPTAQAVSAGKMECCQNCFELKLGWVCNKYAIPINAKAATRILIIVLKVYWKEKSILNKLREKI
jgi:hypothetical protein